MKDELTITQQNEMPSASGDRPAATQKETSGREIKRDKIIYGVATGIVSLVMLFSIINFNLEEPIGAEAYKVEGPFAHLKLPDYMRIELTIAKTLGLLALLIPGIPVRIREFAYFGFAITLISASFAHFSVGDGLLFIIDPLLFLVVLIVSYVYFHKLRKKKSARPR